MLDTYFLQQINTGPWVPNYTLNRLQALPDDQEFILPICSIATTYTELQNLGDFILPPLYHEALTAPLKQALVARITECFPIYQSESNRHRVRVVELPQGELPQQSSPKVLAFSVDTAVEEHGPHLPLGTDTIQSYSVLHKLAEEIDGFEVFRPLEYGQLTWGLPFGFSVDITCELLQHYVTGYCNAIDAWLHPEAVYVVDVHGSITHRQSIVDGINESSLTNWAFRWLHDPLPEFASERGDQHAGGVETILVERVSANLLDPDWWPNRLDDIAAKQMSFQKAVELTPNLQQFISFVKTEQPNGIIGDINNYHQLDAEHLFDLMMSVAQDDVQQLLDGNAASTHIAGKNLW